MRHGKTWLSAWMTRFRLIFARPMALALAVSSLLGAFAAICYSLILGGQGIGTQDAATLTLDHGVESAALEPTALKSAALKSAALEPFDCAVAAHCDDEARWWTYAPSPVPSLLPHSVVLRTLRMRYGWTLGQTLAEAGLAPDDVTAVLRSLQPFVDFRRLRAGNSLVVRRRADGEVLSFVLQRSLNDRVHVSRAVEGWHAERMDVAVETVTTKVSGIIQGSLWETLLSLGEDPRLAISIADIFSWDIDFYTEVHPGDSFRVIVDKHFVSGELMDYGAIVAAEFVSLGEPHRAFLFRSGSGSDPTTATTSTTTATYYDANGQSLRKQLLKSPLKFAPVTSGFGWRRHPILGYSRAHDGIDYGVPTGTPVWSVADGVVIKAGWFGGYGKYIEVRHPNGWSSGYGHLSAIRVRAGQRVSQKDMIGLVGSTGLSTGPHLHYGLMHNGIFVNPAKQKFEPGKPLGGADKDAFNAEVKRLLDLLAESRVSLTQRPWMAEG